MSMDTSMEGNRVARREEEERKGMLLSRFVLWSLLSFAPCVRTVEFEK